MKSEESKLLCLNKYRDLVIKDIEAHAEWREEVQHGKMFGFAVCEGNILLKAYSGQILGKSDWEGYVPAIYDYLQPDGYFKMHEAEITAINNQVKDIQATLPEGRRTRELEELKHERKERSQALQRWLFSQFMLTSPEGRVESVLKVFSDYARQTGSKQTVPPGGTGECCAPKLLNYANTHDLRVLHLAEFWYGDSPKGIIRHHGKFYEPCQAKCQPIFWFLTKHSNQLLNQGVRPLDSEVSSKSTTLQIIFEDDWFVAINKPSHLLSVPGKRRLPNAQDMLREQIDKPVKMTHRLDMDTSGILLAAKTEEAFVAMQRLFAAHEEVKKEYIAVVSNNRGIQFHSPLQGAPLAPESYEEGTGMEATIALPLSPDFLNRPMQKVDYEEGKEAITIFTLITESRGQPPRFKHLFENEGCLVIKLKPLTGRTHQLRVHCAHPDGLGMPIVGDPLYGNMSAERMYLHASKLTFKHPFTHREVVIESRPDWI